MDNTAVRQIANELFSVSAPLVFPKPWTSLTADTHARSVASTEVLARLPSNADDDGPSSDLPGPYTARPPSLDAGDQTLVFLCAQPGADIDEVVTSSGCLMSQTMPIVATVRDGQTRAAMAACGNYVVAAATIEDMAILRALEVPATLMTGLASFGPQQLPEFQTAMNWRPGCGADSDQETDTAPIELVLLGWSPAELSREMPDFTDIRDHLRRARAYLGVRVEVSLWKPRPELLAMVRYQLRFGAHAQMRNVLRASLDKERIDFLDEPALQPPAGPCLPPDYDAARSAYERACRDFLAGRVQPSVVRHASRDVCDVIDRDLVPAVDGAPEDLRVSLDTARKSLCRLLHRKMAAIELRTTLSTEPLHLTGSMPLEEVKQVVGLSEVVLKITRELKKCMPRARRRSGRA